MIMIILIGLNELKLMCNGFKVKQISYKTNLFLQSELPKAWGL